MDAQLNWANEYPLSEGRFTEAEFAQSFGGAVCVYKWKDTQKRSGSDCEKRIKEQDFFDIRPGIGIKKFEDAVGILRVTRRRMAEYFRTEGKLCKLWREECGLLDKLYFDVRMQELRQGGNESELYRKINEVILSERKIAEEDEMKREEIAKKISEIGESALGVDISGKEDLKEQGVDSLGLVALIVAIEDAFSIAFADEDLQPDNLDTLEALTELTGKYI